MNSSRWARRIVGIVLASGLVVLSDTRVQGWGNEGHRTIGLVAQTLLTAQALAGVKSLLGTLTLEDVATCADEVRTHERNSSFVLSVPCVKVFPSPQPTGTANWHFVNLNVADADPADRPMDAFCKNDCVVARILSFQAIVQDKTAPVSAQALAFLVHFVGDVHQPLHAAERNNDRGGNLVTVVLPNNGATPNASHENLHSIWDTALVQMIAANEAALAATIAPQVADAKTEAVPAQIGPWVHTWARQSEDLARTVAYKDNGKDIDPQSTSTLSAAYEKIAMSTIESQIAKAGVRLATLINLAFN